MINLTYKEDEPDDEGGDVDDDEDQPHPPERDHKMVSGQML